MRSFPIYCLANVLSESIAYISPQLERSAYTVFTLFELIYFSYFLTRLIHSKKTRRLTLIFNITFLIMLLFHEVRLNIIPGFAPLIILECIILLIPCIVYIKETFSTASIIKLWKEASFWMVIGISYYFTVLILILLFTLYFASLNMISMAKAIYSANNYVQFISYTLYIIAIICSRKKSY